MRTGCLQYCESLSSTVAGRWAQQPSITYGQIPYENLLSDLHDLWQIRSAALTCNVWCSSALLIIALGDDGERAQYAGAEAGMGLNEPLEPSLTHA